MAEGALMRILGIAVVKNEADVVEVFVRHTRALLDGVFVVDNGSTDATPEILRRLSAELPGVGCGQDPSTDHRQERILTAVARALAADGLFDFVLPLDADELVRCEGGRAGLEQALAALPAGACGTLPWVTYVPRASDAWTDADAFRRIVHRRAQELEPIAKVAFPLSVARDPSFGIEKGNHGVWTAAGRLPAAPLAGVSLGHFPVRSPEQLVSKVLVGEWALSTKHDRLPLEGWHWRALARRLEARPVVTQMELEAVAAGYAAKGAPPPLVRDPFPLAPGAAPRWPELAAVDPLARIAAFAGAHFRHRERTPFENPFMAVGRTAHGVIGYHRADLVIGRSIAVYGEWAAEELAVLLPLVGRGDNVVDVGANIGTHAIPLAQRVAPGTVFAFEPQRLTHQMLCANAALNGVTNLVAYQAGAGDAEGTCFVPPPAQALSGNIGNFNLEQRRDGEAVRVAPLDAFDLPPVKLVKVDVEGMERKVLAGARRLIARDRPVLFVENNIPDRSAALIEEVFSQDYRAYWHLAPYFNPANHYGEPRDIFGVDRPEINMVCVPRAAEVEANPALAVTGPEDTWQAALERARQAAA
jgi:FkbM family methyltransferase